MGALGDLLSLIATPLYYAISAVLVGWHKLFTTLGMDPDGGSTWALSIIGLTVVIRALLIPLFVKQIKSSRNMQLLQPKVRALQEKYKHDREKLAAETMNLYRDTGTNPFAACLPLLVQMPIFITLFHLLNEAARDSTPHGFLNVNMAESFGSALIFGRIPLAESFWGAGVWRADGGQLGVMLLALFLVLAMTATTFVTQRQLMSKNMPADAMSGPYAQQQKMLLYILPVAFGVGGVAFPIGVLLYWTTSNLWTMGQQFYVIRNNPAPGTPAFAAKEKRDAAKAARHGGATATATAAVEETTEERRPAQRQQPKRQSRDQRRKGQPNQPNQSKQGNQAKSTGDAGVEKKDGGSR
ncbi:membrane protein insertase YidC [Nocardioides bruguierae]|uniref:membrane protein insertase YidC n=1 Tax=Nocardioides bruguierae TaxID=2945102 RepID=UPI002021B671|nr:membrane protein insertase YidC [Nocardioides bruguierae]MCL8026713.1 membrane protein insertase YidC [Nocardioides bruguierae]